MPKVTICIPAYNASRYIGETLDSILAQSFAGLEIIVSDNHSTDDTCDVVKRYRDKGVQLAVCPLPPVKTGSLLDNCRSSCQNWNSLVHLGSGDYVGIFHADDVYEPSLVQKQVDLLDHNPQCSGVFPIIRRINVAGQFIEPAANLRFLPAGATLFDQPALVDAVVRHGTFFSPSGPLLRRSCWQSAGPLDATLTEQAVDAEFFMRLAGVGPIGVLHEHLVRYRVSPHQDSANSKSLYRHQVIPLLRVLSRFADDPLIKPRLSKTFRRHYDLTYAAEGCRVALNMIEDGMISEARELLERLPRIGARGLWEGWTARRYRLPLARAYASGLLRMAARFRIDKPAGTWMKKSRILYGP
jgi:glycosyltransferase involved in cell wall biosynthesis